MEINGGQRTDLAKLSQAGVEDGGEEGAGGEEGETGDVDLAGEVLRPAEEEVGEESRRGVRVGGEPAEDGVMEVCEGVDDGEVAGVAEVLDVLDAGGDGGVGREGEDEGLDGGGVGGEEGGEGGNVLGSG